MPPRAGDRGCLEREGGPYQQGGPPWLLELLLPVGVGVGFPRSYLEVCTTSPGPVFRPGSFVGGPEAC